MKTPIKPYEKKEAAVRMWVWPGFKKKVRLESLHEGVSTIEYTRRWSLKRELEDASDGLKEKKKGGGSFEFRPFG